MFRILVPVDGSDTSLRAVDFLQTNMGMLKTPPEVHLLNVQAALRQGVTAFVSKEQIDSYHRDEGMKALAAARAKLDAAKQPYQFHIGVGEDPAQVIARYVQEKKCDQVVMGTRGLGSVAGMLLGSVTTKTIHLVEVPILLVR